MRILYVSGSYVPSRRASGVHVMRMCAALARQGHQVTLVTKESPRRQEEGVEDEFAFYGVAPVFELVKLPRPARRGGGLRYLSAILRMAGEGGGWELFYCREPLAAWRLARRALPVVYEAHGLPTGRIGTWVHRRLASAPGLRRLVVISEALRLRCGALGLVPACGDTVVAHDAADPLEWRQAPAADERTPRLGYVGHLYPGRGVEILFALAQALPECQLHVIGGSQSDLDRWREARPPANLRLHGFVAPSRLAHHYRKLDILLMPYQRQVGVASGRTDTVDWMSPMKLFEYMAAGRAIVASDLPVLREVLRDERDCLLVPPDEPRAWIAAVRRLIDDPGLRRRLGEAARTRQRQRYTWDARARAVLARLPPEPTAAASRPVSRESRPLGLCMLRPTLGQGGADRVTVTLLESLDRDLFRPSLVLTRAEGELLPAVPGDVPVHHLGGRRLWTAWWPLARRLRRCPPRILLSTSSGANLVAVVARLISRRPMRLVLSERNALHRASRGRLRQGLELRLKRWLYPRADCLTAVSRGLAGELIETLALPSDSVRVVYNPVVTPEIGEQAAAPVAYPWLDGSEPVLLGVGRLVRAKRFDLLIESLAHLRGPRPPRLVLLGEGPERAELTRLAVELGVADRLWLAGFDSNPFRYMARCTVFVLSSDHEGLPGALIQAMACGAPVVATDCPHGPSEIVQDGVTGLLVPPGDRDAMVAGIERLLDDPALRRTLGERARRAVERFSTSAVLGGYVAALLGEPVEGPERS